MSARNQDINENVKQFVATPTFNIISCQHYVATLIGFLHIEQELQASSPHLSRSVQGTRAFFFIFSAFAYSFTLKISQFVN